MRRRRCRRLALRLCGNPLPLPAQWSFSVFSVFPLVCCVNSLAVAFAYRFGNSTRSPIRAAIGNPNCKTGVAAV
jgi:hypothetical protein